MSNKKKNNKLPISGIYSVVNKINGKMYIGQSIDIERRWEQHKYGKGNIILRNSILKHGIENFEFNILEIVDINNKSKIELTEVLTELEQKWFNVEKPFLKQNGYNIQKTSKPNLTPNKDKHFGAKISKIKIDNNHTGKPLVQHNLNGEIIKEWKSAAEVERKLGYKAENISASCLKKVKSSNNFIWRFKNDLVIQSDIDKLKERKKPITRKIQQLNTNGDVVKIWDSLKQLVDNSEFDNRGVKNCCDGKRLNYKGYTWKWLMSDAYVCGLAYFNQRNL